MHKNEFWRIGMVCLLGVSTLTLSCHKDESASASRQSVVGDVDDDGIPDAQDTCDGRVFGGTILLSTQQGGRMVRFGMHPAPSGANPEQQIGSRETVQQYFGDARYGIAADFGAMTGAPFSVTTSTSATCNVSTDAIVHAVTLDSVGSPPTGVVVPSAMAANVASLQAMLDSDPRKGESYAIYSAPGQGLWVVSPNHDGVIHGLYYFLYQFGARWFLPSSAWTILPHVTDLRTSINTLRMPKMSGLVISGNGGFGSSVEPPFPGFYPAHSFPFALPPSGENSAEDVGNEWTVWSLRNQFPSGLVVGSQLTNAVSTVPNEPGFPGESMAQIVAASPDLYMAKVGGVTSSPTAPFSHWHNTFQQGLCAGQPCAAGAIPDSESSTDYTSPFGISRLIMDTLRNNNSSITAATVVEPSSQYVSVEQPDGHGDCACAKCMGVLQAYAGSPDVVGAQWSPSDAYFHYVNQTYKRLDESWPQWTSELGASSSLFHGVAALAYADHSGVPSIPLDPHLFVTISPYGMVPNFGTTPDEHVQKWTAKALQDQQGNVRLRVGIDDEWLADDGAGTENNFDRPQVSPYDIAQRVRSWENAGIEALSAQTAYSGAKVGFSAYIAAALAWDPAVNESTILDEVFSKSFGSAATPMRRMFERWWKRFDLTPQELNLSFSDVQQAEAASFASCADCKTRVDQIADYVQYLRVLEDYITTYDAFNAVRADASQATRTSACQALETSVDAVLTQIWNMYPSNLLHSSRLFEKMYRRIPDCPAFEQATPPANPADAALAGCDVDDSLCWSGNATDSSVCAKWAPCRTTDASAFGAGWSTVQPIAGAARAAAIANGATAFATNAVPDPSFSTNYVPLGTIPVPTGPQCSDSATPTQWTKTRTFKSEESFALAAVQGTKVSFQLQQALYAAGNDPRLNWPVRISVVGPAGDPTPTLSPAATAQLTLTPTTFSYSFCAAATGTYTVRILPLANVAQSYVFAVAQDRPFVQVGTSLWEPVAGNDPVSMYFYVPPETTQFALAFDSAIVGANSELVSTNPRLFDSQAREILAPKLQQFNRYTVVTVPPGESGKVWSVQNLRSATTSLLFSGVMSTPRFLGVPTVFSYSPNQMLVPVEFGPCDPATAVVLNPRQTLPTNGCAQVLSTSPIVNVATSGSIAGTYPTAFSWSNNCGAVPLSGVGTFTAQQYTPHLIGPLPTNTPNCPTLIHLYGSSATTATIQKWDPTTCGPNASRAVELPQGGMTVAVGACLKISQYPGTMANGDSLDLAIQTGSGTNVGIWAWNNSCGDAADSRIQQPNTSVVATTGPINTSCPIYITSSGWAGGSISYSPTAH